MPTHFFQVNQKEMEYVDISHFNFGWQKSCQYLRLLSNNSFLQPSVIIHFLTGHSTNDNKASAFNSEDLILTMARIPFFFLNTDTAGCQCWHFEIQLNIRLSWYRASRSWQLQKPNIILSPRNDLSWTTYLSPNTYFLTDT
jgi:hypothetical protein